jgi:hypothetical protein
MNWPSRLRKILTLRCEEASVLSSRELDEPLDLTDRLALWGHLLVCRSCQRFRRQLHLLRQALRRREASRLDAEVLAEGLSVDARRRIAEVLRHAAENHPDAPNPS